MSNEKLTPMLQQYMEIKKNTNDALVFYRLGDFYELFFEDAITASKVLDLVLTARSAGGDQKAPMCGVPHHAAKSYIQKLVNAGYKVAIVEQVEDPKSVKGIVKREVVEIVTPGTFIENEDNDTRAIAAIHTDLVYVTIVSCDLINGRLQALRVMNETVEIIKTLQQFQVKEFIASEELDPELIKEIRSKTDIYISYEESLDASFSHKDHAVENGLRRLMAYLKTTQKRSLNHLGEVQVLNDQAYLKMDYSSMTNLELIESNNGKQMSLYRFLNKTRTNMGARALKDIIMKPLISVSSIRNRHNIIESLHDDFILNDQLISHLKETYDIHRIVARFATDKHNAQDFVRLSKTLYQFSKIKDLVRDVDAFDFINECESLNDLALIIDSAIYEDAPVMLKEGRTFKKGLNKELDELIDLSQNGKKWLVEYECQQRELTGIKNLKVSYTRAFGYYIEISKGQIDNVKESFGYIRKQTLTNAERYISEELQDYEVKISEASSRILEIETVLFEKYSDIVKTYSEKIHKIGEIIAFLDIMLAFAEVSLLPGFSKPKFTDSKLIDIKGGMHPVLKQTLSDHQYISSDSKMDDNHYTQILTGPNMGGKSTYMRMVALNVIMAQLGCYVPSESLTLSIVDQIFTRMGASDDILMGQSTFMVEMMEAQTAITRATENSLILFDEIGRGTSTYDGMALAQAIIEHIHLNIKARTIFSTHYHELVALESMYEKIMNVHVEVHEENDHVTFLYKVLPGRADRSYGINVARLAHLPLSIIERAKTNLQRLELSKDTLAIDSKIIQVETQPQDYLKIKDTLNTIDINKMTPLEAMTLLMDLQKVIKEQSHE